MTRSAETLRVIDFLLNDLGSRQPAPGDTRIYVSLDVAETKLAIRALKMIRRSQVEVIAREESYARGVETRRRNRAARKAQTPIRNSNQDSA